MLEFLLASWVFYSITIIGIIVIIAFLENEKEGWSHTFFILLVAYFCFKFNLGWKNLVQNPLPILKWVGIYIVAGVIWAFFKWILHLKSSLNKYNEERAEIINHFKKQYSNDSEYLTNEKLFKQKINENLYTHFQSYRGGNLIIEKGKQLETISIKEGNIKEIIYSYNVIPPQATNNKARITTWITHWPLSLLWTAINDPIKHLFTLIQSWFQKISNRMFKSVYEDFNAKSNS